MTTLPREIFKAYDIRGIVGRTLTPAIVRAVGQAVGSLARERGSDTFAIGRDGRLSGPELAVRIVRRHSRRRRQRHRRRHGGHADDLFRRASPAHRVQRHGHGQPQSARLQRPQDGRRGRHAVGRRHPGAARAHRSAATLCERTGRVPRRRHRAGLPRPHRRRRQARASAEDRRRLRQRRRRRVRADAVRAAGLHRGAALLRRRRHTFPTTIPILRSRPTCAT